MRSPPPEAWLEATINSFAPMVCVAIVVSNEEFGAAAIIRETLPPLGSDLTIVASTIRFFAFDGTL